MQLGDTALVYEGVDALRVHLGVIIQSGRPLHLVVGDNPSTRQEIQWVLRVEPSAGAITAFIWSGDYHLNFTLIYRALGML